MNSQCAEQYRNETYGNDARADAGEQQQSPANFRGSHWICKPAEKAGGLEKLDGARHCVNHHVPGQDQKGVAERVGFEPTVRSLAHLISNQALSATQTPLRYSLVAGMAASYTKAASHTSLAACHTHVAASSGAGIVRKSACQ